MSSVSVGSVCDKWRAIVVTSNGSFQLGQQLADEGEEGDHVGRGDQVFDVQCGDPAPAQCGQ